MGKVAKAVLGVGMMGGVMLGTGAIVKGAIHSSPEHAPKGASIDTQARIETRNQDAANGGGVAEVGGVLLVIGGVVCGRFLFEEIQGDRAERVAVDNITVAPSAV